MPVCLFCLWAQVQFVCLLHIQNHKYLILNKWLFLFVVWILAIALKYFLFLIMMCSQYPKKHLSIHMHRHTRTWSEIIERWRHLTAHVPLCTHISRSADCVIRAKQFNDPLSRRANLYGPHQPADRRLAVAAISVANLAEGGSAICSYDSQTRAVSFDKQTV